MKTIKQRILYPYIWIIILIPAMILLMFNGAMNIYMDRSIQMNLMNTIKTMTSLMNSQSESESLSELQAITNQLSSALMASELNTSTKFYLLNRNGTILYPRDIEATVDLTNITKRIIDKQIVNDGTIQRVNGEKNDYYIAVLPMNQYKQNYDLTILFLTNTDQGASLIHTMNVILLLIIMIATVVGIILAHTIANLLSKPIIEAANYSNEIGAGNFITIEEPNNIKEIRLLYNSMNQMSRRLEAYDNTQKQFLQNASHELRTPLMSIQGYAEGLENNILTDYKHAASIIRKESIRLDHLVEELLTLSRIENLTYQTDPEMLNLSEEMEDNAQRINGLAMKENMTLMLQLDYSVHAFADRSLLSQVVINMISNCIRYAENTILIETFYQDELPYIRVSDDGKGFAAEDVPHLFERFYKGEKGNFGLGLSIVKSAVEYMHGTIQAYNKPEGGAAFLVGLPKKEEIS